MPDQSWTVEVDGVTHTIDAVEDLATGRTAVRVDGRIAARPMQPAESQREFTIAGHHYVLQRMEDGTYELEMGAPPQPSFASDQQITPTTTSNVNWTAIALAIVIAFLGFGTLGWFVTKRLPYTSIHWKPFHPDNRFVVSFPGDPKSEQQSITVPPYQIDSTLYTAERKDHAYLLGFFNMPGLVRESDAPRILESALNGMLRETNSKLEHSEQTTVSERPSIRFVMRVPKGEKHPEGLDEGVLVADYNRIYMLHAIRPSSDSYRKDVDEFLASFKLQR